MRQHVVDIAEQRHFVFADYPQNKLYAFVILLTDVNCLANPCRYSRLFQKECSVILLFVSGLSAARLFPLLLRRQGFGSCRRLVGRTFCRPCRRRKRQVVLPERVDDKILVDTLGKSSVSCPLKPSDSAPLKHSTMPP